jgi:hypothetical protein
LPHRFTAISRFTLKNKALFEVLKKIEKIDQNGLTHGVGVN